MSKKSTANNYAEQYRTPKWQKKRLEIMQRDDFKCQGCGSPDKTLNVHHRFYIKGRRVWEYDNDVLLTLCEDCHNEQHKKMQTFHPVFDLIHELTNDEKDWLEDFMSSVKEWRGETISNPYELLHHASIKKLFYQKTMIDLQFSKALHTISLDLYCHIA